MTSPIEELYREHHATKRGAGFVLMGEARGGFLARHAGTGKRVLDIGCRDGALTRYYREGNDVLGLDIDGAALKEAERDLGIRTKHVDLNGPWDIPSRSFDVVVAAEILEHLYYPRTVVGKIADALVPGGVCLITVPNAFSYRNRLRYLLGRKAGTPLADPTHITHFTVKELRGYLEERFSDVSLEGVGRLGYLARQFPQAFAFDLCFRAAGPKHAA